MDVTSQRTGSSSVPSEEDYDDTYIINTMEFSLPLESPTTLTLSRDDSGEDYQTSSKCVVDKPSKQQGLGLEDDDCCYARGDGGHVMPEDDVQASPELASINSVEAKAESPSKELQRPDVPFMSSKSKVNHHHEPVTPKRKAENSSSQTQTQSSYIVDASARNNISRGSIHSSSSVSH